MGEAFLLRLAPPGLHLREAVLISPRLREFFARSQFAGVADRATARAEVENPVCGDHLVLTLRVEAGRAAELRFLARGCVAAMGCAAAFTEILQGCPLADLAAFGRPQLLAAVGGLAPESRHAAALVLDARDQLLAALGPPT
ncbi:MAG: iron-sulfur cluster assembly scaffold protein [Terriglobales bacterium]